MRRERRSFMAAGTILLAAVSLAAAKVVNRTVATVNGEAVLLSEFEKNWTAFKEQQKNLLPAEQMTPEWEKETRKKILEQMIDDKILLQEAKKRKLRVNQRDLENGVVQVKSRFLPEEGRRALENIIQRAMAAQSPDNPEEAGPDLAAAWKELSQKNPEFIKEADAKFKEELVKEGLNDKQFQDRIRDQLSVVQLTSQEVRDRSKPPTDEEAKQLFDRLTALMQGKEVKGLDEEEAADLQSLARYFAAQTGERVRARHILIRSDKDADFKDKSMARRKAEDIRKKILAGADFAEMAQKHSDDKGSAARGGDLGAFGRGQMVPPFEKAAFGLGVGDVSDVVETDFGFHIIKVEEKRAAAKLRYEDAEDDLKEYIYRVNAQKHFEDFIKNLRQSASIKVQMNLDEVKPE